MPSRKEMATTGSIENVNGSASETAMTTVIPGKAPITIPVTTPKIMPNNTFH